MTKVMDRATLKAECLRLLAEVAIEHPAGHQGAYAARYVLQVGGGAGIELMFEKHARTPANLWMRREHGEMLLAEAIEVRKSPAASLLTDDGSTRRYGRHSGLKAMRGLAHADLLCFRIERPTQMSLVLEKLSRS